MLQFTKSVAPAIYDPNEIPDILFIKKKEKKRQYWIEDDNKNIYGSIHVLAIGWTFIPQINYDNLINT